MRLENDRRRREARVPAARPEQGASGSRTLILPLFIGSVTVLPTLLAADRRRTQADDRGRSTRPARWRPSWRRSREETKTARASRTIRVRLPARAPGARSARRSARTSTAGCSPSRSTPGSGSAATRSPAARWSTTRRASRTSSPRRRCGTWSPRRCGGSACARPARSGPGRRALRGGRPQDRARLGGQGASKEGALAGAAFGYILFFMLYIILAIWGQQVMQGVLEEKSSRVIEVIVSAVKPFELMMGKLTGICLVGLTQFGIWLATFAVLTAPGHRRRHGRPARGGDAADPDAGHGAQLRLPLRPRVLRLLDALRGDRRLVQQRPGGAAGGRRRGDLPGHPGLPDVPHHQRPELDDRGR